MGTRRQRPTTWGRRGAGRTAARGGGGRRGRRRRRRGVGAAGRARRRRSVELLLEASRQVRSRSSVTTLSLRMRRCEASACARPVCSRCLWLQGRRSRRRGEARPWTPACSSLCCTRVRAFSQRAGGLGGACGPNPLRSLRRPAHLHDHFHSACKRVVQPTHCATCPCALRYAGVSPEHLNELAFYVFAASVPASFAGSASSSPATYGSNAAGSPSDGGGGGGSVGLLTVLRGQLEVGEALARDAASVMRHVSTGACGGGGWWGERGDGGGEVAGGVACGTVSPQAGA